MWVPMLKVFDLGEPDPSGNENDTYVSNDIVYKVNNLLNSGSILKLLDKISWHNILFYDTFYKLYGFNTCQHLAKYLPRATQTYAKCLLRHVCALTTRRSLHVAYGGTCQRVARLRHGSRHPSIAGHGPVWQGCN